MAAPPTDVRRQTNQWPVKVKIGKMKNSHCAPESWTGGAPCLHQRQGLRQEMLAGLGRAERNDSPLRGLESSVRRTYADNKTLAAGRLRH